MVTAAEAPMKLFARRCGAALLSIALLAPAGVVVAMAGLCGGARTAWAAGDAEARANAIYKDAKDRFDAKDFEKAVELATNAERIFAHPAITLLKGRALRGVGRLREAQVAFKAVNANLTVLPKPLWRVLTDETLAVSDDMRVKGEIKIEVEPADARVLLDGLEVQVPYVRWIVPGRHKVEAGAANRKAISRDVDVKAGDSAEVKLDLLQRDGQLAVTVPGGLQGVEVRIDGQVVEIAPAVRLGDKVPTRSVAPGKHEVVCVRAGKQVGTQIEVASDATVEARCDGLPEPAGAGGGAMKAVGWSGVAVGTGLFGYGLYGLGSYLGSDLGDPRGIKSTNKHWLGSTYTVVGAAAAVCSYLFLVRDGGDAAAQGAPAKTASAR